MRPNITIAIPTLYLPIDGYCRITGTPKPLQKTPVQRQIASHYPELASGMHLPKFGRVMNPVEAVKSSNLGEPFRPRYAVDVQLLDADGNPEKDTPVYSTVPLQVSMAGNDSGMFQFPPEGTLVETAFTGGRPVSLLCGRTCRTEPDSRISSLANSCNSSARKCRSASPRRGTG